MKIVDVNEFIKHSFDSLEKMAELNVESRREIYISDKLRPYAVDTKNSLTVVNQLEMVPPSKDMLNPFELRFLNNEHTFAQQQYVR